jgi:2-oxoglutarate ferredoxin oxidoreductase subunit delta
MVKIDIYPGWCKKCGICVAFCPKEVLVVDKDSHPVLENPEKCTGCGWCEIRCPDFAIVVHKDENNYAEADSSPG